jgi:hypothetical protein
MQQFGRGERLVISIAAVEDRDGVVGGGVEQTRRVRQIGDERAAAPGPSSRLPSPVLKPIRATIALRPQP